MCLTLYVTRKLVQLLLYADFEDDVIAAGWTPVGPAAYGKQLRWCDTDAQTGTHCLAIVPVDGCPVNGGWESPAFPVTADQYYHVSFVSKTVSPAYWAICFYDGNGCLAEGDHYSIIEPSTPWRRQDFFFKTKYPGVKATIVFRPNSTDPLYLDTVSITPTSRTEVTRWADDVYAGMPRLNYAAPATAGQYLPNTRTALTQGQALTIVLLGDSIANDVSNSGFDALLQRAFPSARIRAEFRGKGGTGWAKHQYQVDERVLQHQPNLVICEAISNIPEQIIPALSHLIDQVRAASPRTEFLIVTPHLTQWANGTEHGGRHRAALRTVARTKRIDLLDLMEVWDTYLQQHQLPPAELLRDAVHMNERGRQLSARALTAYLIQAVQLRV